MLWTPVVIPPDDILSDAPDANIPPDDVTTPTVSIPTPTPSVIHICDIPGYRRRPESDPCGLQHISQHICCDMCLFFDGQQHTATCDSVNLTSAPAPSPTMRRVPLTSAPASSSFLTSRSIVWSCDYFAYAQWNCAAPLVHGLPIGRSLPHDRTHTRRCSTITGIWLMLASRFAWRTHSWAHGLSCLGRRRIRTTQISSASSSTSLSFTSFALLPRRTRSCLQQELVLASFYLLVSTMRLKRWSLLEWTLRSTLSRDSPKWNGPNCFPGSHRRCDR